MSRHSRNAAGAILVTIATLSLSLGAGSSARASGFFPDFAFGRTYVKIMIQHYKEGARYIAARASATTAEQIAAANHAIERLYERAKREAERLDQAIAQGKNVGTIYRVPGHAKGLRGIAAERANQLKTVVNTIEYELSQAKSADEAATIIDEWKDTILSTKTIKERIGNLEQFGTSDAKKAADLARKLLGQAESSAKALMKRTGKGLGSRGNLVGMLIFGLPSIQDLANTGADGTCMFNPVCTDLMTSLYDWGIDHTPPGMRATLKFRLSGLIDLTPESDTWSPSDDSTYGAGSDGAEGADGSGGGNTSDNPANGSDGFRGSNGAGGNSGSSGGSKDDGSGGIFGDLWDVIKNVVNDTSDNSGEGVGSGDNNVDGNDGKGNDDQAEGPIRGDGSGWCTANADTTGCADDDQDQKKEEEDKKKEEEDKKKEEEDKKKEQEQDQPLNDCQPDSSNDGQCSDQDDKSSSDEMPACERMGDGGGCGGGSDPDESAIRLAKMTLLGCGPSVNPAPDNDCSSVDIPHFGQSKRSGTTYLPGSGCGIDEQPGPDGNCGHIQSAGVGPSKVMEGTGCGMAERAGPDGCRFRTPRQKIKLPSKCSMACSGAPIGQLRTAQIERKLTTIEARLPRLNAGSEVKVPPAIR